MICPRCQSEAAPGARFCPDCGAPLPVAAPRQDETRLVTVLFADMAGSVATTHDLDPEEALVAALASCHMLFFLSDASRAGFIVDRYEDAAEGVMAKNAEGRVAVTLVTLTVHSDVAFYLLNRKRKEIAALEEKAKMEVLVQGQFGVSPEMLEVHCQDSNGNEVRLFGGPPPRMFRNEGERARDRGGRSHDRRRND